MSFRLTRVAIVITLLLSLSPATAAQQGPVVTGVAADSTGAPLAEAQIDLFGPVRRAARTGDDGRFAFEGLAPGEYRLVAVRAGFATHDQRLTLAGAERRELALRLE